LPEGTVVGTSSLRRRAQLLARRPDLRTVEFRGNVQTRLRKLSEGLADATFLAMAGLHRLGVEHDIPATPIEPDEMLPAIAQGAIGIEQREHDDRVRALVSAISHPETEIRLKAERSFLETLDGSCQTPIAGLATLSGDTISFIGEIVRPDGSEILTHTISGPAGSAETLGNEAARALISRAGRDFFSE
jgi:hydroxymethylbilane synthase